MCGTGNKGRPVNNSERSIALPWYQHSSGQTLESSPGLTFLDLHPSGFTLLSFVTPTSIQTLNGFQ